MNPPLTKNKSWPILVMRLTGMNIEDISISLSFLIFHNYFVICRRSFARFGAKTRIFFKNNKISNGLDIKTQAMSEPTDNLDLGNGITGETEYPPKGKLNKLRELY